MWSLEGYLHCTVITVFTLELSQMGIFPTKQIDELVLSFDPFN